MIRKLLWNNFYKMSGAVIYSKKTGKKRSVLSSVAIAMLVAGLVFYVVFAVSFFLKKICEPFCAQGFDWLYISIISLLSVMIGVVGSVMSAYSTIFLAKDNDLLFSLPIKPYSILIARMLSLYLICLLFEMIVMIPGIIVYFCYADISPLIIIYCIIVVFIVSLIILLLSCVFGFCVAFLSSKFRNKNIIVTVVSLIFLAGYYWLYFWISSSFERIFADPSILGNTVIAAFYPFYLLGRAAEGSLVSLTIMLLAVLLISFLLFFVISKNYISLVIANKGVSNIKTKRIVFKAHHIRLSLLKKEFKRFFGSSVYMLNCGLGLLLMLCAAVFLFVKGSMYLNLITALSGNVRGYLVLTSAGLIAILASTCTFTAPSVSLEGKNIWILQSLPAPAFDILLAKLGLHCVLTVFPALLLSAAFIVTLSLQIFESVLLITSVLVFIFFDALFGLAINLKFPNLNWTNETTPVKQGMSTTITLFGGWVIVIGFGALYVTCFSKLSVSPLLFLICLTVLLIAVSSLLLVWLKRKGTKIISTL